MRALLLVASLLGLLVNASPAKACCAVVGDACGFSDYDLHVIDPAHADDTTPPSAPIVDVEVVRYDQGCGPDSAELFITMKATDDRAGDRIGFLLTVASGDLTLEVESGGIVPHGPVSFYFDQEEVPFEGEVEIRAIDLNGNIGPPTIVVVSSSNATPRKRFASVRGGGPMFTYGLIGVALVVARRRRRKTR